MLYPRSWLATNDRATESLSQVEWQLPEGEEPFDRVISIEMLEHMKNYEKLFAKLSTWIKPGGLFFTHIFTHKEYAYHFEAKEE
jgi:cyclopropane fatty-acyl-phospholipid synthase-like methyltransferase